MPLPLSVTAESDPSEVFNVTVAPPVVMLLPLMSLSCTVTVVVLVPLAVMDAAAAVIVEVAVDAGPGTKFTSSLSVIGLAFNVPVTVAVPAAVEEVRVAVYVPSPLFVTAESDPSVVLSATVPPLAVRLLPFASLSCTVIVVELEPLAVRVDAAAVMVEVTVEAGPGTKFTVSLSVIGLPFNNPLMVAVPVAVDDVNVAV